MGPEGCFQWKHGWIRLEIWVAKRPKHSPTMGELMPHTAGIYVTAFSWEIRRQIMNNAKQNVMGSKVAARGVSSTLAESSRLLVSAGALKWSYSAS